MLDYFMNQNVLGFQQFQNKSTSLQFIEKPRNQENPSMEDFEWDEQNLEVRHGSCSHGIKKRFILAIS